MSNRLSHGPGLGLLLLSLVCQHQGTSALTAHPTPATPNGIVVEQVEEGLAAYQAGLQPGDILLQWQRAALPPAHRKPENGGLSSPFDLEEVELEQAPRGEVTLLGVRGNERLQVRLPLGKWGLKTRPRLTEAELATYDEASALIDDQQIDDGLELWRQMASRFGDHQDPTRASWLFRKIATIDDTNRNWASAEEGFRDAVARARVSGSTSVLALVADSQGAAFQARGEFDRAQESFLMALAARQASAAPSLSLATSFQNLGRLAFARRDLPTAEDWIQRALDLRQELAPHSPALGESLHVRGSIAGRRGDLAAAEGFLRRAVSLREKLAPSGIDLAKSLNNLGNVAFYRGDLAPAGEFFRRAMVIHERLDPEDLGVAIVLNGLGVVAWARGGFDAAEVYYRRALSIQEKLAPDSLSVANSLSSLGLLATDRGSLSEAKELNLRALAIRQERAPNRLEVAKSLNNLGEVAFAAGDSEAAEGFLERALTIANDWAPHGIDAADSLQRLAEVARSRSQLESAEAFYERSLAIHRERAPASSFVATVCWPLATLHRLRRQFDQALDFYDCAIEALEAQRGRLGGSDEARSSFGARYAGIYREAVDLLVAMGQPEKAFHVLERFRARELLALLGQRDLVFASDIPHQLERRRRSANRTYDQVFGQWMRLPEHVDDEQRQAARHRLDQIRRQQDEIRAEIRAASPRLATLQDPQPADLDATIAALDPGTLLLSFSIGDARSTLFTVGPGRGQFQVFRLDVGEASLRGRVERFRETLGRGRFDRRPGKVLLQARQLSQDLLAPAAPLIEKAERLLILADGPLHSLPFASLAVPRASAEHQFLVEAKPVHLAASATVQALMKQERRDRTAVRLTAFGDPQYPVAPRQEDTAPRLRAALRVGLDLTPLPATRDEVEGLRQIYPQTSRVFFGSEATEERAKAVGKETTHLHIASHGLLNDQFPLDSALAFSIPERWREGENNGLLQAWEIFEQVRLDAELVTLSACDTGLGKVLGGEGLIGLTRAFRYAGARSVLASLWSVSDTSTSELMKRFYGYLRDGQSKTNALRNAQLDLLRDTEFSHPFHWAGFELVGDWR